MSNEMIRKLQEFKLEIILEENKSSVDLKMDNAILTMINRTLLTQVYCYGNDMSPNGARVKKLPHNHI